MTNEMFVTALRGAERTDRDAITTMMGNTASTRTALRRVGVNQLRGFLESRVEECYRRNVAKIVPLLQNELRMSESKLIQTEEELNSLSIDRLRKAANIYREKFSKELTEAIHGTAKASPGTSTLHYTPVYTILYTCTYYTYIYILLYFYILLYVYFADEWGETLDIEQLRGGSFMEQDQVRSTMWQTVLDIEVGHNKQKLFGGAQYHRALREFSVAVRHMKTPLVTEDEIANAAGMGDVHDGVNFLRSACVIAIEKAQQCFEPMLVALRHRSIHIMRRLCPIVEHMAGRSGGGLSTTDSYNRPLQDMIRRVYDKFVDSQMEICLSKCRDDVRGLTRYVTWDSDGRGGSSSLYKNLPTPKRMAEIYAVAVEKTPALPSISASGGGSNNKDSNKNSMKKNGWGRPSGGSSAADRVLSDWSSANGDSPTGNLVATPRTADSSAVTGLWDESAQVADYHNLLQLTEEMLAGRKSDRTNTVVTAIVQHIIKTWTDHFARTVSMKFNCFFLMPFLDEFPSYLVSS